jgi:hypothetical protein
MEVVTNQPIRRPAINVIAIRDLLKSQGHFESDQAEAIASAINESIVEQDTTGFATKGDVKDLKGDMKDLKNEIILLESRLTLKMGAMIFGAIGLIKTLQGLGWW